MRIAIYVVLMYAVALLLIGIGHIVTHTPTARPYSDLAAPLLMIFLGLATLLQGYVGRSRFILQILIAGTGAAALILTVVGGVLGK
jgi:hypothetical protein